MLQLAGYRRERADFVKLLCLDFRCDDVLNSFDSVLISHTIDLPQHDFLRILMDALFIGRNLVLVLLLHQAQVVSILLLSPGVVVVEEVILIIRSDLASLF